jgi:Protein of unknown function (DUF3455)
MRSHLRILSISAVALMLVAPLRAQDSVDAPRVPTAIQVPGNPEEADFLGYATGTQNYLCNPSGSWPAAGHPEALLSDRNGVVFAHHFFTSGLVSGPTWQSLRDGSYVIGARVAGVPAPSCPAAGYCGTIPWLLLKSVFNAGIGGGNPDQGGLFSAVSYIQRVKTSGGSAPNGTCTPGQTASVPYTATYYFYDNENE